MTQFSLGVLRARVRRERNRTLVLGIVVTGVVAVLVLASAAQRQPSSPRAVVLALLAVGAAAFLRAGMKPVDDHPGIRAIVAGGQDIVWIYALRFRHGSHRGLWLQLGLVNGERAQIELRERGDERIVSQLIQLAPRATTGYDPIFERRFRADPSALRRG